MGKDRNQHAEHFVQSTDRASGSAPDEHHALEMTPSAMSDDTTSEDSSPGLRFLRKVANAPPAPPSQDPDLSGATIGRYKVLHPLGRGAMGIVYAAQDLVLRRPVALKVLPQQRMADPDQRRRFLREARSAAASAHGNTAAIYEVDEANDQVFIAMELVEGQTLREMLQARAISDGPLPVHDIARLGIEIASGLVRAHEAGIIHRDLKPENIMITPDGHVKILDFGLAKFREGHLLDSGLSLTGEGRLVGTPSYMAPEAKRKTLDQRADLFSVGVILYEMATCTRPFTGVSAQEILVAIDRDPVEPPSQRHSSVPIELETIILRCLEKRPEDRMPTAKQLVSDLKQLLTYHEWTFHPAESKSNRSSGQVLQSRQVPSTRLRRLVRSRGLWAACGLLVVSGVVPLALRGRSTMLPPAREPSPLLAADAVLACPPLEATGVDQPSGWLGAAAASLACQRAKIILGGNPKRIMVPAALLDLPSQPSETFPRDPLDAPDVRTHTLAVAHTRAAAYLDGHVAKTSAGFTVQLVLKTPADIVLARGDGQGVALHQAIRAAMDPLLQTNALPKADAIDPSVATWMGLTQVDLALGMRDFDYAIASGVQVLEEQAKLAPHAALLGAQWNKYQASAASMLGLRWDDIVAPAVDRSSAAAFARTAPVHAMLDLKANAATLADEARRYAAIESSPLGRAMLAEAEAQLRDRAGDDSRAHALFLAAIQQDPTGTAWEGLSEVTYAQPSQAPNANAYTAWIPDSSHAWNVMSIFCDNKTDPLACQRYIQRACILAPGLPLYPVHLSMHLLSKDQREQTRAVAADMLSNSANLQTSVSLDFWQIASEYVLASVDAKDGRLGSAFNRIQRVLFALPMFGRLTSTDVYLATLGIDLAMVFDQGPKFAEQFFQAFVEPDPPHLYPGRFVPSRVASVCAFAARDVAQRCFSRLHKLLTDGYFREELPPDTSSFVAGAQAFADGDYKAAAIAFRPFVQKPGTQGRNLLPLAFDRAGELDLAERIDGRMLSTGPFNGAGLAHLRTIKRALAQGDRPRAQTLARQLLQAWSVTDAPIPALTEVRALLSGKQPPKTTTPPNTG